MSENTVYDFIFYEFILNCSKSQRRMYPGEHTMCAWEECASVAVWRPVNVGVETVGDAQIYAFADFLLSYANCWKGTKISNYNCEIFLFLIMSILLHVFCSSLIRWIHTYNYVFLTDWPFIIMKYSSLSLLILSILNSSLWH